MYHTNTPTPGKLRLKSIQSSFLKTFYSCLILLFIGILLPSGSYAQTNDVVTNQTITQLSKAGIGKQIIFAKIDNSVCNFDVSTDGLIALKRDGVPDDIVAAMIAKGNPAAQAPAADPNQNNTPDQNAQNSDNANAQANVTVTANTAPPELPTYQQPPCPTDGYLWTPGYWAFNLANGFFWVPGVWVAPPNPGLLWTPAYWGFVGGVYRFHHGYWGASVGFYGGINYGYGYGGVGFVGGGWYGRSFRYNTAVVNVNTTVIHNTYVDRTVVVNNTTVNRTSFNGTGGVTARPRPEELAAMKAPHVQPTSEQLSHQQAASTDKNQFARVNNGHPSAAAISRVNTASVRAQGAGGSNLNHNNNAGANNTPTGGTNRAATNATTTNPAAGNKTAPATNNNNNRQNNRQSRSSKPARQPRNNNKKDKN